MSKDEVWVGCHHGFTANSYVFEVRGPSKIMPNFTIIIKMHCLAFELRSAGLEGPIKGLLDKPAPLTIKGEITVVILQWALAVIGKV